MQGEPTRTLAKVNQSMLHLVAERGLPEPEFIHGGYLWVPASQNLGASIRPEDPSAMGFFREQGTGPPAHIHRAVRSPTLSAELVR